MPLIIVDGPEAAGKTTLIREIQSRWAGEQFVSRHWGPVDGWNVYVSPMSEDYYRAQDPQTLVVWDRSWASEVVYNDLLDRGREIDEALIDLWLADPVRSNGLLLILTAPPDVLRARRTERLRKEVPHAQLEVDLPVDPDEESAAFLAYARKHDWSTIVGDVSPGELAERVLGRFPGRR